jgi:hypothetical protein
LIKKIFQDFKSLWENIRAKNKGIQIFIKHSIGDWSQNEESITLIKDIRNNTFKKPHGKNICKLKEIEKKMRVKFKILIFPKIIPNSSNHNYSQLKEYL